MTPNEAEKLTEDEVRELLGDSNIVNPVLELLEGGYSIADIWYVFTQLRMKRR